MQMSITLFAMLYIYNQIKNKKKIGLFWPKNWGLKPLLGHWPGPDAKLITIWQLKKLGNIKVVIQNVYTKTSENMLLIIQKHEKTTNQ